MRVQLAYPGATSQQLEAHLRASFPRYSVATRAGVVIVGDGAATGVMLKPSGQGQMTLGWAFPSMGAQIAVTLFIVLTGLLPGLIVFGLVWLSVKGGVARLKQEVSTVLAGGAPPPQAALPVAGTENTLPASGATPIGGVVAFVMALLALAAFALGPLAASGGVIDAVFWILLGAGALMLHGQEKRGQAGPAGMVIGIPSVLHGLAALPRAIEADGFFLVRSLIAALFWIAAGGLVIAASASKSRIDGGRAAIGQRVAGGVVILFGLLAFFDLYDLLDRGVDFNVFVVAMALRGVLWLVLGGVLFARASAAARAPAAAPAAPAYPQQAYPQHAYPQQQLYPQQGYPQQGHPPPGGQWPGSGPT